MNGKSLPARLTLAATAFLITVAHPASGALLQLRPSADTTLFQANPDNNLGAVSSLAVGGTAGGPIARGLIRFDLAGRLPANAKIISAQLQFEVVKVPSSGGLGSNFQLHRQLQDWVEGTKASGSVGALATEGESTWNSRKRSTLPWSQPGGAASVDFSATPSASVRVAGVGVYTFASTPELVADVQAWVTHSAADFGWMMISEAEGASETARRIGAREAGEHAPLLILEYSAEIVTQPRIERFEVVTNEFRLAFRAEANRAYQVEFRERLAEGDWISITNITPFPVSTPVLAAGVLHTRQGFLRLISP